MTWRLVPWALLIVAAALAWALEKDSSRREGVYRHTIDSLKARVAYAETQRQTDSVQVIRYVNRVRTLRERITDTVVRATVDTLIERCLSCVGSAANVAESYRIERDFWRTRYDAAKPSKWDKAKPYVFGGLGLYVGAQACRL